MILTQLHHITQAFPQMELRDSHSVLVREMARKQHCTRSTGTMVTAIVLMKTRHGYTNEVAEALAAEAAVLDAQIEGDGGGGIAML